jgi:hypothetical protein
MKRHERNLPHVVSTFHISSHDLRPLQPLRRTRAVFRANA